MSGLNTNIRFKRRSTPSPSSSTKKAKPTNSKKEVKIYKHFDRKKVLSVSNSETELPEVFYNSDDEQSQTNWPKNQAAVSPRKRSNSTGSRSSNEDKYSTSIRVAQTKYKVDIQNDLNTNKDISHRKGTKSTARRPVSLSSSSSEAGKTAATLKSKKLKKSSETLSSSANSNSNNTSSSNLARLNNLTKALRSVENRIQVNLDNIKHKDELRLSIKDIHYQVKPSKVSNSKGSKKKTPEISVVTESYIQQLKNEIDTSRTLQPHKLSINVKELKSEISRYRKIVESGGNVLDAVNFDVTLSSKDLQTPSECTQNECQAVQAEGKLKIS